MKRWLKPAAVSAVVLGLGGVLRWTLFRAEPLGVAVAVVEKGLVEDTVVNSRAGTVKSRLRAAMSPAIPGLVVEVAARKGMRVREGDVLLRLDRSEHEAQVRLAEKRLAAAEAGVDQARLEVAEAARQWRRTQVLAGEQVVSETVMDEVRTRASVTVSMLDSAVARVGEAEAALEVATCRLLEALSGEELGDLDRIRLCQKAEHDFAGVPCGIMDQFIVTVGRRDHALLLDCETLEGRQVPMASDETALIITHCGVAHELGKGEYAKRRADCQRAASVLGVDTLRGADLERLRAVESEVGERVFRRARHVIGEIERVLRFASCLEGRDWVGAGGYMYESHASLRDDYEVSCGELDMLVEIARGLGEGSGVYGARLTGAGFGGCTITLVRGTEAERVRSRILEDYRRRAGIEAQSFISPPVAGVRLL